MYKVVRAGRQDSAETSLEAPLARAEASRFGTDLHPVQVPLLAPHLPVQRQIDDTAIRRSGSENLAQAFDIFMATLRDQGGEVARYLAFVEAAQNNHNLVFAVRAPTREESQSTRGKLHGQTDVVFTGTSEDIVDHMFKQDLHPNEEIDEIMAGVDPLRLLDGVDTLITLVVRPDDGVPVLLETLTHEFAVHAIKWRQFIEAAYEQQHVLPRLRERVLDMPNDHDDFGMGHNAVYAEMTRANLERLGGVSSDDIFGMPRHTVADEYARDSSDAIGMHMPFEQKRAELALLSDRAASLNTPLLGAGFKRKPVAPTDESSWCSCCFLTTACVRSRGLPDDCHELETLRQFRDEYVLRLDNGKQWFDLYYRQSPLIVHAIAQHPEIERIYAGVFATLAACVNAIERGRSEEAFRGYVGLVVRLSGTYLPHRPLRLPPMPDLGPRDPSPVARGLLFR